MWGGGLVSRLFGHTSQYCPRRFLRSSQSLHSNDCPTSLKASSKGTNTNPRSVSAYSICGGLPPKSVRSSRRSLTMSRRRPTRVRLLIGSRLECSSIVRLGPVAKSRMISIVHLSPIICSAPAIGQPSRSRLRTLSPLRS